MTIMRLPLSQIIADSANNSRSILAGITELANDIKINGLLQPLVVTAAEPDALDSRYVLRAGFRRFAALQTLGTHEVDVTVSETGGDIINLVENLSREDISVYDFATAIVKLNDDGMSASKIGKHLQDKKADGFGTSGNNLNNIMRLRRNLAPAILEQWQQGHPAATIKNLLMIVGKKDEKTHQEMVDLWNRLTNPLDPQTPKDADSDDAETDDDDAVIAPAPKKRTYVAALKMLAKLEELAKASELSRERYEAVDATMRWVFGHADSLFGITLEKEKDKPLQDAQRD